MSVSDSCFSLGLREYRFNVNEEQFTQYYKISRTLRPRHHAVLNPGEYVSLLILRSPKTTESSPREAICGSLGAPLSFRNVARYAILIRSSSSVAFLRPNLSETRNRWSSSPRIAIYVRAFHHLFAHPSLLDHSLSFVRFAACPFQRSCQSRSQIQSKSIHQEKAVQTRVGHLCR